ncbi:FKBP-type peptidyl-prolyl cis-trans isomerase [Cupriavidus basilensis]
MSSELQVEDIRPGDGKEVVKGALITTQYTGYLEDGTKFDSSHDRGKPFQCVIGTGRVIKGWDFGLMGMKAGGKRKLHVPAQSRLWRETGRGSYRSRTRTWSSRSSCSKC